MGRLCLACQAKRFIKRNVALNAVITRGVDFQLADSIEHLLLVVSQSEFERSNDGWSALKLIYRIVIRKSIANHVNVIWNC